MLLGRQAAFRRLCHFWRWSLRTIVYVDGYNLYYGVLRKTALKWLDLFALFQDHVLDSQAELVEVRYYTAPVLGRMCDDIESPQRQRQYLQALRKMYPEKIVIVEGKIIATTPFQRLVEPLEAALATVRRYLLKFAWAWWRRFLVMTIDGFQKIYHSMLIGRSR